MAKVLDFLGRFLNRARGPVAVQAAVVQVMLRVAVFIFPVAVKRLMWSERFQLEEPAILVMVAANEIEPGVEGARWGLIFLALHEWQVDPVLRAAVAVERRGHFGLGSLPDPWIIFLPAEKLPAGVGGVVGGAAGFKVMVMIGDEMAGNALIPQQIGDGIVKGFQRPPTAMEEIRPPGVQIPRAGMQGMEQT